MELIDFLWQANGLDGAEGALLFFVDRGRNGVLGYELEGLLDGLFCHLPQLVIKGNGDALSGAPVEDFSLFNGLVGHFFEAEGLGAKLNVVVVPVAFFAMFVFDGDQLLAASGWCLVYFDEVGEASDVEAI